MSFLKVGPHVALLTICLLSLAITTQVNSQEDFASIKSHWNEISKQLEEKEKTMADGDAAASEEFKDLVDSANLLIDQMRTAGVEALKSDPQDQEVTRTLMGIMVNDAHFGRDKQVVQLGDELIAIGIDPRYFEVAAETERLSISSREIFEELSIRQAEAKENDLPRVKIVTSKGEFEVELFENEAPNTVANFISLIENGFYEGIVIHRVVENFMAQTGDPEGTGSGGPGYTIPCECYSPEARRHFTGSLSMAKTMARDTGGSQFFVTFKRTDFLDGKHTVFGRVLNGWDVLDNLTRTHTLEGTREIPIPGIEKDKILNAEVVRKREHEYKPRKVGEPDEPEKEKQPPVQPDKTEDPGEAKDKQLEDKSAEDKDKESKPEVSDDSKPETASESESKGGTGEKGSGGENEEGDGLNDRPENNASEVSSQV